MQGSLDSSSQWSTNSDNLFLKMYWAWYGQQQNRAIWPAFSLALIYLYTFFVSHWRYFEPRIYQALQLYLRWCAQKKLIIVCPPTDKPATFKNFFSKQIKYTSDELSILIFFIFRHISRVFRIFTTIKYMITQDNINTFHPKTHFSLSISRAVNPSTPCLIVMTYIGHEL